VGAAPVVAAPTGNDTAGACTDAAPCSVRRAASLAACGDTIELLGTGAGDGIYKGANYTIYPWFSNKTCTAGAVLTVKARNDGGVVFDGEFVRTGFWLENSSYLTFQGFDSGNSLDGQGARLTTNLTVQRVTFSNTKKPSGSGPCCHVVTWISNANLTVEDVAIVGTGRNTMNTYNSGGSTTNNRFRRVWIRYEGNSDPSQDGMTLQASYFGAAGNGSGGNIYENVITVWDPEQQTFGVTRPLFGGLIQRGFTDTLDKFYGMILYGYAGFTGTNTATDIAFVYDSDSTGTGGPREYRDIFSDARSQTGSGGQPFSFGCGAACTAKTVDRITGLRQASGNASAVTGAFGSAFTITNGIPANDCTDINSCPNFYTGTLGAANGARNCYEYTNGVLGSSTATQALWPWRMDTRIKAALARARTAGTGGTALQGGAGAGYEAATVTSEIASRYGPIPAACNRAGTFTPDFPVVTDFPSTLVLDTFDRANGPVGATYTATIGALWSIVSNQAAAPASFARNLHTAATATGPHEVFGTVPTIPGLGGPSTILVFGATDTTDNNQYRLMLTRAAGANAKLRVMRADGAGALSTVIPDVDLGADVADGQSYGVRVSALQTITVYWKYTDGNWYRIASVIDNNFPIVAPSMIGFGGTQPMTLENFGGGTCCGGAVSPANIGRFGSRFPTP
jgi:hypothetical protein